MRSFVVLGALIVLATAPTASAGHVEALYLDWFCLASEGRHVHADCTVQEDLYLRQRTPDALPSASASAGYDSGGLILPVSPPRAAEFAVAGLAPWYAVGAAHRAGTPLADPLLLESEAAESAAKRDAFDAAEGTGYHFRLVCGWDLTQTRPLCAVYDPEADPETALLRTHRDRAAEDGGATAAASATSTAAAAAPAVEASVQVRRLLLHSTLGPGVPVEPTPPAADAPEPVVPAPTAAASAAPVPAAPVLPAAPAPHGALPAGHPDSSSPRLLLAREAPGQAEALVSGARPGGVAPVAVLAAGALAGLLLLAVGVLAHRQATRANVLANPVRDALYRAALAAPGSTITELAAAVGVRHSTATHHLDLLAEVGLLVPERVGNRKHWFGNGHVGNRSSRITRILPRLGRAGDLVRALQTRPEARPVELAAETGLSVPGVHWHLARLEKLGVVESTPGEHGRQFRLAGPRSA